MRQAKFVLAVVLVVGAAVAVWWYTTKSTREADVMDTRGMVEEPPAPGVLEATPADSAAMADTVSVY